MIDTSKLSPKELKQATKIVSDPILWAEAFVYDPESNDGTGSYNKIKLNLVEKKILGSKAKKNVIRVHRRSGKSYSLCIRALWRTLTHESSQVLIICPDQSKVDALFDLINEFIRVSPGFDDTILNQQKRPAYIRFKNGSTIKGFTTGSSSQREAKVIRGQCLPAGQLVTLYDGSQKPIECIDIDDIVLTYSDYSDSIIPNKVTSLHRNGIKDIYEIVTEAGRVVQSTGNHPFYINGEWVETENILPGDLIGTPVSLPFGNTNENENLIKFLAYMIGDGTCSSVNVGAFSLTTANHTIKDEFISICNNLNIRISNITQDKRSTAMGIIMPSGNNSVATSIIKQYNLYGKKCDTKSIPDFINTLSKQQLSIFINRLYSTDGWVSNYVSKRKHNQIEVGYCTTSFTLATQLQYCLQKFGIIANIQFRTKSLSGVVCKPQYILKIRNQTDIYKFLIEIGPIFGKEERSKEVLNIIETSRKLRINNRGLDTRRNRRERGSIYYDKVISCKVVSKEETYNLTVENTHTFIVNGIITHNTSDEVMVDEAAFLNEKDWTAITAVMWGDATRPNVISWIASTPTQEHGKYYHWCCDPKDPDEPGEDWFRLHVPVTENPDYPEDKIAEIRISESEAVFRQEWLAEFPDVGEGVFRPSYIDRAQRDYTYYIKEDIENGIIPPPAIRTMGVDWDKYQAGPNIIILELDYERSCYKVVYHEEIPPHDFVLTEMVNRIIKLDAAFNCKKIYVDRGYGEMQVETLHLYGINNPLSELDTKVEGYTFSDRTEVLDPIGEKVKKPIKPVMVNTLVKWFEDNKFIYSKYHKVFTKQLHDYRILSVTSAGIRYTEENEHIIDATMLAAWAMYKNYADPFKMRQAYKTYILPTPKPVIKEHLEAEKSLIPIKIEYDDGSGYIVKQGFSRGKIPQADPDFTFKRGRF